METFNREARLPPAAGAIGPRPHSFSKFLAVTSHLIGKNGVWGPWPQPPEALEFDESSFTGSGMCSSEVREKVAAARLAAAGASALEFKAVGDP